MQDVGALSQADPAGEYDQLIRLLRRCEVAIDDHGIGNDLGMNERCAAPDAVEGLPIQAGDEVGTPQHG